MMKRESREKQIKKRERAKSVINLLLNKYMMYTRLLNLSPRKTQALFISSQLSHLLSRAHRPCEAPQRGLAVTSPILSVQSSGLLPLGDLRVWR